MKTIEDKNNILLKRREVKVIIEAEKNPSMQEAVKIVAEHFKVQEENIEVKQVKGKFGRDTFLITANIYYSKEDKDKTEPKKKEKKAKEATEEKKEEKPEEKIKESKKEEGSLKTSKSKDFDSAQKSKISDKTSEKDEKEEVKGE